jgi:hypothetical protein
MQPLHSPEGGHAPSPLDNWRGTCGAGTGREVGYCRSWDARPLTA